MDEGPEPAQPREEAEEAVDVLLPAQSPGPNDQQDLEENIVHAVGNASPNTPLMPSGPADASALPLATLPHTPIGLLPAMQTGLEENDEGRRFFTPTFRSTGHPSDVTTITPGYRYRNLDHSASSSPRGTVRRRSSPSPRERYSPAPQDHVIAASQKKKYTRNRESKRRRQNEWTWYKTENGMRRDDDCGEGSSKGKKRMI